MDRLEGAFTPGTTSVGVVDHHQRVVHNHAGEGHDAEYETQREHTVSRHEAQGLLQEVVGPDVQLVDSAQETAKAVAEQLKECQLLHQTTPAQPPRYFVTDIPDRFERVGGAFLGEKLKDVITISLEGV